MHDSIKVHVVDYGRHRNLVARYKDPVTGKHQSRSCGTRKRRQAEKFANKWEAELQEGRYKAPSKVTWAEFRIWYEDEVLPGLADRTADRITNVFNAVERHIKPQKLAAVTSEQIGRLVRGLREEGRAEDTIKAHLAHLKSALNRAERTGKLHRVPEMEMPKRTGGMKGRPITTEEFERMLTKIPDGLRSKAKTDDGKKAEIPEPVIDSWRFLLRGLWWSGLRIEEAMNLHWTDDRLLCVDFDGRRPMFRIQPEGQKNHKAEVLPMAPEFAEFLLAVPEDQRTGFVFDPLRRRETCRAKGRLSPEAASKAIRAMGEAAGIKVAERNGKVKFASAHDLRRAFGFRWSSRVMPAVLQQLMRHDSIETTMEFYVGRNAEAAADALWGAVGNTPGNTAPETKNPDAAELSQTSG